jgi:hypothetical protein
MMATMNPFMTERRGFIMNESSCAELAAQFFVCEQTNRINRRRTTSTMRGNSTRAQRSQVRFPGGRDISFACEDGGFNRSRPQSFANSLSAVPTMLLSPTEARRQNENP